jgi:hypothetical protein
MIPEFDPEAHKAKIALVDSEFERLMGKKSKLQFEGLGVYITEFNWRLGVLALFNLCIGTEVVKMF